jgi:chitinase
MKYDVWGDGSPTVGPNAPLDDTCTAAGNQAGSAVSAVRQWNNAGFPSRQIVLGVAGYGHAFIVRKANAFKSGSTTALASYPTFDAADRPSGDSWDGAAGVDMCGVQQGAGGIYSFWGLVQDGYLNANGTPKHGIAYAYDNCSQTVSNDRQIHTHILI